MKKDFFSMKGKTVVFTGGCGDLGKVMVKALLQYGANVVIPARTDSLDESYSVYKDEGRLVVIPTDLKLRGNIKKAYKKAEAIFGGIDVLVNCAAFGGGVGGKACEYRLDKIDDDTWSESIDGTLGITFRCTRDIIPYFDKRGGGNIINIGDTVGMVAPDFAVYGDNIPWNPPPYGAGKSGVIQFTRYCAAALAPRGVRVNCLTPGPFPNITSESDMDYIARMGGKTMLGRTGSPAELCGALLLLASDASSYMTGSNLVVDGGLTQW